MVVVSFGTLKMLFHCFPSYIVSDEKSAIILVVMPLYIMCFLFLTAIKTFSFSLVFSSLTMTYLDGFLCVLF